MLTAGRVIRLAWPWLSETGPILRCTCTERPVPRPHLSAEGLPHTLGTRRTLSLNPHLYGVSASGVPPRRALVSCSPA